MRKLTFLTILFCLPFSLFAQRRVKELMEAPDSVIMAPAQVHQYDQNDYEQMSATRSSLDLQDPDNVRTEVEYQPQTGYYIIHTKIGDTDIATPYLMTQGEYSDFSARQAMQQYWQQKIGEVEHNNERKFDITDMKFNIGPADKVFGPGGVQLKTQGSAELLFGFKHQKVDNPALTRRARNNNILNFDEKIQLSVNGKVGEKINFNLNYNTESSFDFDRSNMKLSYKGKEDEIIQSIEAGNVSMNLNSSLITGSQALFGIKTDLKFGKLSVQALISQQNSTAQSVSSKGGAQMTSFEVSADHYDENRHFFLSYWFRDNYEKAMAQLPYIASGVTINKIEVWITNKRGSYDQARNIVAFADLAESKPEHVAAQGVVCTNPAQLQPYNAANDLYSKVTGMPNVRDIQQTNSTLAAEYPNWVGGQDYEKIESARLLSSSEYTLNSALGYISLRTSLNQDEVLCVAYEYSYGGQVYQVGEFSTDGSENLKAPNALILKMLKSSNNSPMAKGKGTWDLMMKNVYSLGASQMSADKFELYINYRNDSVGTDLQYLPEGAVKGQQLLRVMNLDKLDQKNNPNRDGRFDYVEGYTALSSSGRIIFPVLEPFGSYLKEQIGNDAIAEKYIFQELYDSTLIVAQEISEKNKFTLTGKYKGTSGSEIRLNAMNVPRGSVTVTAGGATLTENVDYTVDYTMGTVTILNQSILDAGTNVNVKLENQSTFSMQRKALYGAHLEYAFSKDFVVGGTLMHMHEKPLTTKVSTGNEPISNTIWGLNGAYKKEFMWLTNAINAIPWIQATQPSSLQVGAEFAQLIPGHTKDVGKGKAGTAYIDDFESTKTNIDIHYPNYWFLASTPLRFEEATKSNDISYGKNRAHLAWFAVDPIFGHAQANTPTHIKDDVNILSDHRTRIVYEQELYPNRETLANEDTRLTILNLSYYPEERGAYNIDASQIGTDGKLTNPTKRWGGIMRKIDNTDFETANIEYIEFWLMDPLLTNTDKPFTGGDIYIDLGDISEDILKDGKKAFEHGLPINEAEEANVESTIWGRVPRTTSTVVAFSNEAGARDLQDVGLNGLSTEQEFMFSYNGQRPYYDYVEQLKAKLDPQVRAAWQDDPYSPLNDPAGDNYHYYRGTDYDDAQVSVLNRYKHYNGTEGNSKATESSTENYGTASTLTPDIEDINSDNTLSEYEKYFEYHVNLRPNELEVGRQYITQKMVAHVKLKNGETQDVTWYQFKIPLRDQNAKNIGGIRNFKSIRFVRMYLTGFEHETFLRFGTLNLVRGEWRTYTKDLSPMGLPIDTIGQLDVQAVNIEENSSRQPVNYVLPPGISRQTDPGQAQLISQNEQAMVLRVHNLMPNGARAVYKKSGYDMRQYKRLQMFVHAEKLPEDDELQDGDLSVFIRLGSDMRNNYYEYEIPLSLTPDGLYNNSNEDDRRKVWLPQNEFDFPFEVLTNAKLSRNKAKRSGNTAVSNTIPYVVYDDESGKPQNRITVMGNPSLGEVENIMIGVRNKAGQPRDGEIWVNELRLSQFNEEGGVAAMGNVSLGISDIAQVNWSGRIETAGYGSIESNVMDRNMENMYQMSVSAALEAGRLFPEQAKLQIPLYFSYSKETTSPDYDPLDTDIKLKDNLDTYETRHERDSVKAMTNSVQQSTNFSVSNAKVNIHSKKKDMFYDPANFSISYSQMKQEQNTPEMEQDLTKEQKGQLTYQYSFNPQPWEPFKDKDKVKDLKWISELNLYYLPQSWGFSTDMHRTFTHLKMRDFNSEAVAFDPKDLTFSKDWMWNRNFDFKYDLTKTLKFSFQSAMNSTVDEAYYTPEIIKDYAFTNDYYEAWKDTVMRSLRTMGTPYQYQQVFTASYSVPFNRFKAFNWMTANASYTANYNWNRTATRTDTETELGNQIIGMRTWQVDGSMNFESLYSKSKYLKEMYQYYGGRSRNQRFRPKTFTQTINLPADSTIEVNHRIGSDKLQVKVTDANGNTVPVKFTSDGNAKIMITSKREVKGGTITITSQNPNERTPGQKVGDMGLYVATMIKKVQVTYRNTNSMVVPGFYPQAGFMGQRKIDGIYAPGYDFSFGFFSDDFVDKAKRNNWLSSDSTVVQPATHAMTSDLDIKVTLEPLPGLKIQLNGKRYEAQTSSIIYTYDHLQETFNGSFNITQVAIKTAFDRIGKANQNYSSESFTRFLQYRDQMLNRVQAQYEGTYYPTTGFLQNQIEGGKPYDSNKGRIDRNSADVIVPAFLAAYTGRDVNKISTNPFLGVLNILPNWSVTFDGLGRLPWMKDHFRSVNITHAYTCKYAIGSYNSYSTWVGVNDKNKSIGFVRDVETGAPLPSSAYDISSVSLTEAFSPLVGVNMAMKNSMTAKFEYRKQRNLTMNITSVQLMEGQTNEFVIGWGYTIKDFDIILKLKSDKQNKVKNDLKLNVDVSYKNIKTLLRKVEENITQASSGNKVLGIKVSADYVLSSKINLQLFYDHQGTTPFISSSYPVKVDNVGINIKLMLTR